MLPNTVAIHYTNHRRNNRRDRGRLVPNNVLIPNFFAVVSRMQDLASEFSKIFRGNTPGPSQWEAATPSRNQHPARPLAGRGAQAPWCWDPNLHPLNFSTVVVPLTGIANCNPQFRVHGYNVISFHDFFHFFITTHCLPFCYSAFVFHEIANNRSGVTQFS